MKGSKMKEKEKTHNPRKHNLIKGFLSGAIIMLLFVIIVIEITGIELIGKNTYKYYQGLDERYGKYYSIENIIEKRALKNVEKPDLDSELIPYLMKNLDDEYSEYFTKKEYDEFARKYLVSYSGIGVSIKEIDDKIYIVDIIKNSPADKSKIPVGSVIKTVDGKKALDIDKVSEDIRGKAGTKVDLECEFNGKVNKYSLTRENIEDPEVESKVYDESKGIGYIKISGFKEGTAKAFSNTLEDLKKKGCKKFIIDLRGNTGGVMQEGIDCADAILPKADIIKVKERKGKMKTYSSDSKMIDGKFVLLVDDYTASASEIFAYAVKDNDAGKLVGDRTFGKGVIQGIYNLRDESKLKLTIAEYFSPKGSKINKIGIEPDIKCDTKSPECLNTCVNILMNE